MGIIFLVNQKNQNGVLRPPSFVISGSSFCGPVAGPAGRRWGHRNYTKSKGNVGKTSISVPKRTSFGPSRRLGQRPRPRPRSSRAGRRAGPLRDTEMSKKARKTSSKTSIPEPKVVPLGPCGMYWIRALFFLVKLIFFWLTKKISYGRGMQLGNIYELCRSWIIV